MSSRFYDARRSDEDVPRIKDPMLSGHSTEASRLAAQLFPYNGLVYYRPVNH